MLRRVFTGHIAGAFTDVMLQTSDVVSVTTTIEDSTQAIR